MAAFTQYLWMWRGIYSLVYIQFVKHLPKCRTRHTWNENQALWHHDFSCWKFYRLNRCLICWSVIKHRNRITWSWVCLCCFTGFEILGIIKKIVTMDAKSYYSHLALNEGYWCCFMWMWMPWVNSLTPRRCGAAAHTSYFTDWRDVATMSYIRLVLMRQNYSFTTNILYKLKGYAPKSLKRSVVCNKCLLKSLTVIFAIIKYYVWYMYLLLCDWQ